MPYLTVWVKDAATGQGHYVIPFLTRAGIDCLFAFVILWLFRNRSNVIPPEAIMDRSFPPDVVAYMKTIPWWRSFGFWGTVLVLCVVALYHPLLLKWRRSPGKNECGGHCAAAC